MAYQDPYQQYQQQYGSGGHNYPPQTHSGGEFGHGSPRVQPQDTYSSAQYAQPSRHPQDSYNQSPHWQSQHQQQPSTERYDPYVPPGQAPHPYSNGDFRDSSDTFVNGPGAPYGAGAGFGAASSMQNTPLIKPQHFHDEPSFSSLTPPKAYGDEAMYPVPPRPQKNKRRALWFWILLAVIVVAAAGVCVYLFIIKPKQNDKNGSNSGKNNSTNTDNSTSSNTVFIGRSGTTVTMDNGATFNYTNEFGGFFVDASKTNNPFNNMAQAQADTPPLNQTWDFSKNIIRGVNIGGWLVLEPFITPAIYQKYQNFPGFDSSEWTISEAMRADTASGGITQIEDHYKTFITEQDFAEIVAAGLNWIRLPIPYWAIEVWDPEPFLPNTAWTYILKAFEWARKYGLRINLDLHTLPGSQNGWNHSGKFGPINWMAGPMGVANAERSLDYMRIIIQFISQPEYSNLVPMFGIVNEPFVEMEYVRQFYLYAYTALRQVTGIGKGPIISVFDRFLTREWDGFLAGADRVALDTHKYFAFDDQNKPDITAFVTRPCTDWGPSLNATRKGFGIVTGGEWSLGYNDCGLFLVGGVADIHRTTNCESFWNQWEVYPDATKAQLQSFALSSMEGMRDFFFWTWKISPAASGRIEAPLWSYKLGLDNGWIPKDPSKAIGHCAAQGVPINAADVFNGQYAPSATGGAGAPQTIDPAATATVLPWPPTQLVGVEQAPIVFPTYTATGPVATLPGPTPTPPATATLNGWAFPQDTQSMHVPISGCAYPDPWGPYGAIPTAC